MDLNFSILSNDSAPIERLAFKKNDIVYRRIIEKDINLIDSVQLASLIGIGPEYLGIIQMDDKRMYFKTKFYKGVKPEWNEKTKQLMNEILDSELKYHHDFWFKNILEHTSGRYLAIDWEQRGNIQDVDKKDRSVREDLMRARYDFMLGITGNKKKKTVIIRKNLYAKKMRL